MPSFTGKKNQNNPIRTEGGVVIWSKNWRMTTTNMTVWDLIYTSHQQKISDTISFAQIFSQQS